MTYTLFGFSGCPTIGYQVWLDLFSQEGLHSIPKASHHWDGESAWGGLAWLVGLAGDFPSVSGQPSDSSVPCSFLVESGPQALGNVGSAL